MLFVQISTCHTLLRLHKPLVHLAHRKTIITRNRPVLKLGGQPIRNFSSTLPSNVSTHVTIPKRCGQQVPEIARKRSRQKHSGARNGDIHRNLLLIKRSCCAPRAGQLPDGGGRSGVGALAGKQTTKFARQGFLFRLSDTGTLGCTAGASCEVKTEEDGCQYYFYGICINLFLQ